MPLPKALLDRTVGEAYAHVQGESLKAYAALLVRGRDVGARHSVCGTRLAQRPRRSGAARDASHDVGVVRFGGNVGDVRALVQRVNFHRKKSVRS